MSDYHKQTGREGTPIHDPAHQPHPAEHEKECAPLPQHTPPTLEPPRPCPDPHADCKCPQPPPTTSNCLEKLIERQLADIAAADKSKAFKTELDSFLAKFTGATQAYTRDKYVALVTEWRRQDAAIAELIRKLECAVPCWRCILDCYLCPLLNDLHYAQKWLYGDGHLYEHVHDLYDLQYWYLRNRSAKQRTVDRITAVLTAWTNPAATIDAALTLNKGLTDSSGKVIGTEPGKAIYDVFLRLVPLHLAIAPPAIHTDMTTKISQKYTKFCECDLGTPDDCCGLDVGERSLRQQLIGLQPYLIDPNHYFKLICCLVEQRYAPAKDALSKADADLAAIGERIKSNEAKLANGWAKTFETNAKGAIPSVIDCCDYEPAEVAAQQTPSRAY
jgi:hypothetical protein